MLRFSRLTDYLSTAFMLGILGLFVNLATDLGLDNSLIHPGNILIFMSAIAFGMAGGVISATVAAVPEALLTGDLLTLQIIGLSAIVGLSVERFPKIPSFLIAGAGWLLCSWAPLTVTFGGDALRFGPNIPGSVRALASLSDVLFALVAGSLLLNPGIRSLVTKRPKQVLIIDLLIHVLPLVSTLFVFLTLLMGETSFQVLTLEALSWKVHWLTGLGVGSLALPALFAYRLGVLLTQNYREFAPSLTGTTASFSGLSSDFWRRQGALETRPLNFSSSGLHTDGNLPNPSRTKLNDPEQGICAVTRNGTVTFVNRKFKSFCCIKMNDVIGKRLHTLGLPPTLLSQIEQIIETTFVSGPQTTELKVNHVPDSLRFLELATLRSDSFENSSIASGPDGIIITARDITDRRTVESHLLQGQKLDSLGNFMSGMAHSMNNALTAIAANASFARILNCGETSDRTAINESLTRVIHSAKEAGAMIRELLNFAEGRPGIMQEMEFGTFLSDRLEFIKQAIGDKTELIVSKTEEKLGFVGDKTLITQALTNLILNAKESYPEGHGRIELSLDKEEFEPSFAFLPLGARPGRYIRLKIRDYGSGMNAETLSKAFNPLYSTKKNKGHSGLGLSIVYAIVRAHDGFLTTESALGKGTTLSLYFPLVELHERPSSGSHRSEFCAFQLPDLPHGNSEPILVVEDDATIRPLVVQMLNTLGYKPIGCANGEEALEQIKKSSFRLAIVDMIMPKLNGAELIAQLQERSPATKVLLMTGHSSLARQSSPPKTELIEKPFEISTLAEKVSSALQ